MVTVAALSARRPRAASFVTRYGMWFPVLAIGIVVAVLLWPVGPTLVAAALGLVAASPIYLLAASLTGRPGGAGRWVKRGSSSASRLSQNGPVDGLARFTCLRQVPRRCLLLPPGHPLRRASSADEMGRAGGRAVLHVWARFVLSGRVPSAVRGLPPARRRATAVPVFCLIHPPVRVSAVHRRLPQQHIATPRAGVLHGPGGAQITLPRRPRRRPMGGHADRGSKCAQCAASRRVSRSAAPKRPAVRSADAGRRRLFGHRRPAAR